MNYSSFDPSLMALLAGRTGASPDLLAGMYPSHPMHSYIPSSPGAFQNPLLDAAYGAFMPMAMRSLVGGITPRFAPNLQGGMPASAAYFSQQYMDPFARKLQDQASGRLISGVQYLMTGNEGAEPSGMLGFGLGAARLAVPGFNEFINNVTGGDLAAASRQIASMSRMPHELTAEAFRGMVEDGKLSKTAIGARQAHTQEFHDALETRIYGPAEEGRITPDLEFTRGFDVHQIAQYSDYMSARDIGGFRGMTGDERVGALNERLSGVMEVAAELFESRDIIELQQNLERLTQGDRSKLDSPGLKRRLEEMADTAAALGVSGKAMMEATAQLQNDLIAGAGVAIGGRADLFRTASGRALGGVGGMELPQTIHSRAVAAAVAMGDTSLDTITDIQAPMASMFVLGMGSPQGKDAIIARYMLEEADRGGVNEAGEYTDPHYRRYMQAMRSGTRDEQMAATRSLFRSLGVTEAEVSGLRHNERAMTAIMSRIGSEGLDDVFTTVMDNTMHNEFRERRLSGMSDRAVRAAREVAGSHGVSRTDVFDARKEALVAHLRSEGESDLAAEIEAGAADSRGLDRILGSRAFDAVRDGASVAMDISEVTSRIAHLQGAGWAQAGFNARMKAFSRAFGRDEEANAIRRQASQLARAGDHDAAARLLDEHGEGNRIYGAEVEHDRTRLTEELGLLTRRMDALRTAQETGDFGSLETAYAEAETGIVGWGRLEEHMDTMRDVFGDDGEILKMVADAHGDARRVASGKAVKHRGSLAQNLMRGLYEARSGEDVNLLDIMGMELSRDDFETDEAMDDARELFKLQFGEDNTFSLGAGSAFDLDDIPKEIKAKFDQLTGWLEGEAGEGDDVMTRAIRTLRDLIVKEDGEKEAEGETAEEKQKTLWSEILTSVLSGMTFLLRIDSEGTTAQMTIEGGD